MGKGNHLHIPGLAEFHEELDHQIPRDTEQVRHPDLAQVRHEIVTELHARVHNASLFSGPLFGAAWRGKLRAQPVRTCTPARSGDGRRRLLSWAEKGG